MKRIGVTGGIGSGKTYVCELISALGYPVFYSDSVAKSVMTTDEILIQQVKDLIGENAYLANNALNKEVIAQAIFSDESKRLQLNKIVHPAVYRAFDKWVAEQKADLVFMESALMIDTGNHKELDAVILVVADLKTRIERVVKRESITKKEVLKRIEKQSTDDYKKQFSNYVIQNSESCDVKAQLIDVIEQLKK